MNTSMIIPFPAKVESGEPLSEVPISARLAARVAVGVHNATRTMCCNILHLDHAGEKARQVAFLVLFEVIGRASMEGDVTVGQLLEALYELAPEDSQGGGAA